MENRIKPIRPEEILDKKTETIPDAMFQAINEFDILKHPFNYVKASTLWENDYKRKLNAEKYGYEIIYIWESEMKKKSDNELIKLIFFKLNL